jgi:hypothetical protein
LFFNTLLKVIEIEHFLKGSEHRYKQLKEKKNQSTRFRGYIKKRQRVSSTKTPVNILIQAHSSRFFTRTESNHIGNQALLLPLKINTHRFSKL